MNRHIGMTPLFSAPAFDAPAAPAGGGAPGPAAPAAPGAEGGQPGGAAPAAATGTPTPSPSPDSQPKVLSQDYLEHLVEIKVDGKVEQLPLREVLSLSQQGRDYTRKTQALSDERKRFESDRSTILAQERQKWEREYQEYLRRQAEGAEPKDAGAQALEKAQALEQRLEDERLESVLKSVLAEHKGVNEQVLLFEARKRGIKSYDELGPIAAELAKADSTSFEERFNSRLDELLSKGEHPRIKKYNDEFLAKYLKDKERQPAPVGGSGGSPSLGDGAKKPKSLEEAQDLANELMSQGKA
jgi:hypothetical protein